MSVYVDVSIYAHSQPPYPSSLNPSITVYYSASFTGGFIDEVLGCGILGFGLLRSFLFEFLNATGVCDLFDELINHTGELGFSFICGHLITLGENSNSG